MTLVYISNYTGPRRDSRVFCDWDTKTYRVECWELNSHHWSGPYATENQAQEFARRWVNEVNQTS